MKFLRPKSPVKIENKYIKNINFSGLKGRKALFPATNKKFEKRNIVVISGHHTAHERMLAFAHFLQEYGNVHMIDVPGFGGMDPFTKIGKPISYESYAEYIYTVLKTQKLNKDVMLFAVSIGSEYITRMFQMYPDSQKWVKRYVAFVGFGAGKDFNIKQPTKGIYMALAYTFGTRLGAFFVRALFLNRFSLIPLMAVFSFFKRKMQAEDPSLKKQMIQMEKYLWFVNDARSQSVTTKLMFTEDLRKYSKEGIDVEFHNISTTQDQYFSGKEVRKTFNDLYNNHIEHTISLGVHMPSMMDGKEQVEKLFSEETIKQVMR